MFVYVLGFGGGSRPLSNNETFGVFPPGTGEQQADAGTGEASQTTTRLIQGIYTGNIYIYI